jgi:hypothetical protein
VSFWLVLYPGLSNFVVVAEEGKVNSAIPEYVNKKKPVEDLEARPAQDTKD